MAVLEGMMVIDRRTQSQTQKKSVLEQYKQYMADYEETDPIERLRFFVSLCGLGQAWLDIEPFFDDVISQRDMIRKQSLEDAAKVVDKMAEESEAEMEPSSRVQYYKDKAEEIRSMKP